MNKLLGIFMFIAFLINTGIAIFVFRKTPRNILNKTFVLFTIMCGLWDLDLAGLYYTISFEFANLWSLILRPAVFVGFAIFFHFSLALSKNFSKINIRLLKSGYGIAILLSAINWLGIGRRNVVLREWGYFPQTDIIYSIFALCFVIFLGYGLSLIFRRFKTTTNPVEKNQLKYFFMAFGIIILISATNFLPIFNFKVYPLGNFATLIYCGIISYAIVKHQLMDIRIVIKRSIIYLVLVTFVTTIYISSIFLLQFIFGAMGTAAFVLGAILSGFIISITLERLRDIFDRVTDKIFFKAKYNYQIILSKITDSIGSVTTINDLERNINKILTEHLRIDKVLFLFKENLSENRLISFVEGKREPVIYDDNLENEIKTEMEFYGLSICSPLLLKKTYVGIFGVGNKKSQEMFSMDDLLFLEIISREISIVLENIKLFSEIQRKERLVTIGTMSASISHEIKNPLTSISAFIQLLPKKYNDESFIKEFNKIVPSEIERLKMLSENLLMFSKPSATKLTKININEIINNVTNLIENQFKKKKVKIITQLNGISEISGDYSQLFQVFINLGLNALESLQEYGYLKISTKPIDNNIEVKFEDNGAGINKEHTEKIFEPFFSTKEKGAGLGLAICRNIIEGYNGTIKVESKTSIEGSLPAQADNSVPVEPTQDTNHTKGSTFTILLPKNV